jgi:5-methylcytosine-specific restriction endonuclease McrA
MRANRWVRVTPTERREIYERDGWTCQVCLEPVDPRLIRSRSHWRPSLDHIIPKSLGGPDASENLRLAHWWCNSALSDGRAYTEGDFRVSA